MNQSISKPQLKQRLISNDIDISTWGQGTAKSLENLWQEIQDGESFLTENPFRRTIHFVQIIIRREGKILIETDQELAVGKTRSRNRPPSEKMQPGESVTAAALRGLKQELSLLPEQVTLLPIDFQPKMFERPSPSYPGLITRYNVNTVEAAVAVLPSTDFSSEEESPTDPVRKHFWQWLPEDTVQNLF